MIASLWKVEDVATQTLMVEFYRNLWKKKLGKLEALRQAQLTMLLRYDPQQQQLSVTGKPRKVDPEASEKLPEKPRGGERLPPFFWAAFVLSGDWR